MIAAGLADVRAYLAQRNVTAPVIFGRRAHAQRINQGPGSGNRIIFQPGDDGGRLGRLAPAHQPGPRDLGENVTARSLANWEALYTVFVWAAPNDRSEEATFEAAEELLQWVVRAVHEAWGRHHVWGEVAVVVDPAILVNGTELRAALTLKFPLYDVPLERVFPAGKVNKGTPPAA